MRPPEGLLALRPAVLVLAPRGQPATVDQRPRALEAIVAPPQIAPLVLDRLGGDLGVLLGEGADDVEVTIDGYTYSAFVKPGTYHVYAYGRTNDTPYACMSKIEVTIGGAQLDLTLEMAYDVTGVVHIGSAPSTVPGRVTATTPEGAFVTTSSSRNGSFSLVLPPGIYAMEYLIEGRDHGSTTLRLVQNGILGDNWENEYAAMKVGWGRYLGTLAAYLEHFPGRTATP